MSKIEMKKYGLVKKLYSNLNLPDNYKIGRILSNHDLNYKIVTELGILDAEVSESFKYEAKTIIDYPVTGDFVIVEVMNEFNSIIHKILKRKNQLLRKAKWDSNCDDIVAANIDTIFVCVSLNNDFNIHKLQAYISIATQINSDPVLILTECDSFNNVDDILNEIKEHTKGMDVIITSGMDAEEYKSVKALIKDGMTVVFIGPEHDKVKIVTKLLGKIDLENNLVLLPGGGILINTPEMRELGIESVNITKKFADIR